MSKKKLEAKLETADFEVKVLKMVTKSGKMEAKVSGPKIGQGCLFDVLPYHILLLLQKMINTSVENRKKQEEEKSEKSEK